MKHRAGFALLALTLLGALPALGQQTTPPAAEEKKGTPGEASPRPIEGLTEADLAQILPLIKEHYVAAGTLTPTELSRATVQGLLDRLGPGVKLLDAPPPGSSDIRPFRGEIIDERIGYIRLGSIVAPHLAELDSTLQSYAGKPPAALVIDLRATPPGSEFEQAAEVCKRFCPKGRILFTVRKPNAKQELILTSKEEPRYRGIIVVLVDRDCSGAAEAIAAVLRVHVKAMIIGQQTRGEAVEFADLPLPSGKLLRVAVSEVALPENISVFPGGVKPDLPVDVPQETTDAVLQAGLDSGVAPLVAETERPRMNEAALVAGINPELEAMANRARGERTKAPLRDAVLQRAIDFVTTISIYEKPARRGK